MRLVGARERVYCIVSQARLLTHAEEESGHHPIHNLYLHCQQISADELNTPATKGL